MVVRRLRVGKKVGAEHLKQKGRRKAGSAVVRATRCEYKENTDSAFDLCGSQRGLATVPVQSVKQMDNRLAHRGDERDATLDSDSEMMSSRSGSSSASDSSAPSSPRWSNPPSSQKMLPTLPRLGLGGLRTVADDEAQPSARQRSVGPVPSIPTLTLHLDERGAGDTGASPPLGSSRREAPAPMHMASNLGSLAVDMISPALTINRVLGQSAALTSECAAKFGIAGSRLRFFALTEITEGQAVPVGCSRIAVEVAGSEFSLQAVEDLLTENQRLSQAAATKREAADVALPFFFRHHKS
jgi:hypothetical protein